MVAVTLGVLFAVTACCSSTCAAALHQSDGDADRPRLKLSAIADVRQPRPDDSKAVRQAVRVRGCVTWFARDRVMDGYLVVQDDTAGIWVNVQQARGQSVWATDEKDSDQDWSDLAVGVEVEVVGERDASGYAPMILPRTIRIIDRDAPLRVPDARATTARRLFSGVEDSQRIMTEGILQGFRDDGERWILVLESAGNRFLATTRHEWLPEPAALVDGVIRISGVAASRFTTRGEFVAPYIHTGSRSDIEVVEPPRSGLADAPLLELSRLGAFQTELPTSHRVRCRGIVTHFTPQRLLFLQDGAVGVRVETTCNERLRPGDVVEVAGFIDASRIAAGVAQAVVLVEAQVRRVSATQPPTPFAIQPEDIVDINLAAQRKGLIARPGDYDCTLVTFRARLAEAQQTESGGVLLLASGRSMLGATASAIDFDRLRSIEAGSELQVTGVLTMELSTSSGGRPMWSMPLVDRMKVILRSADDVTIVGRPGWWNRTRLMMALAVVATTLLASLAWVGLLRLEVAAQSARLAGEMQQRHEAAVEFTATLRERNRIAANLHDTLLQTLSAIGMQLQSCQLSNQADPPAASKHLGLAHRMIEHAVKELRGSVWSMRSFPLHGRTFPEAVKAIGEQMAADSGFEFVFEAAPLVDLPIPEFVAGNLLLVVQEAINNAVRHGKPTRISVALRPGSGDDEVEVVVADDGGGFVPGFAPGPEDGHLGLQVMRERVERLGGRLAVESAPGRGTSVHATVATREYDASLAED
jgi:signal transduction histidine kinase